MTLAKSFHKGSKAKGTEGKNRGKAVVVLVANCTVEITAVRPYPISIMGMFNDLRMKESAPSAAIKSLVCIVVDGFKLLLASSSCRWR